MNTGDSSPVPGQSPIEAWPHAIEETLRNRCSVLQSVVVLRETSSTQDHAKAAGISVGTLVTAWRQTAGRGRLGRVWADTESDGVAVTFALPAAAADSLVMRSAVAVARAVGEFVSHDRCGIKWPNDIVIDGRKIAGILVEQSSEVALVGVGINVSQRSFPPELEPHAISLWQLGRQVDRLQLLLALIGAMDETFTTNLDSVYRTYRSLDRLSGTQGAFETPSGRIEGVVFSVDPLRGLEVETAAGRQFLPAATTSVVPKSFGSRYGGGNVAL